MRGTKDEYHLAKIIQVRPIKDKDEESNQLEKVLLGNQGSGGNEEEKKEDSEMKDETGAGDKKQHYEYYVHYENL